MKILKELKVAPCPRTKAKTCECEEVKTISEAEGFVSAKCELEHSDTVKFRFHFTPERETEYAMQFDVNEDPSAGINIAKNIYGLDFNFKLDQEFNENLDKNAQISMIKEF